MRFEGWLLVVRIPHQGVGIAGHQMGKIINLPHWPHFGRGTKTFSTFASPSPCFPSRHWQNLKRFIARDRLGWT